MKNIFKHPEHREFHFIFITHLDDVKSGRLIQSFILNDQLSMMRFKTLRIEDRKFQLKMEIKDPQKMKNSK